MFNKLSSKLSSRDLFEVLDVWPWFWGVVLCQDGVVVDMQCSRSCLYKWSYAAHLSLPFTAD